MSSNIITARRYHDFSAGHRVVGHENKCRGLHGHNYRITFECMAVNRKLDKVGRVIDFGIMKTLLCDWLETQWDHKMLLWSDDALVPFIRGINAEAYTYVKSREAAADAQHSIYVVPFNPTAENMAHYLLDVIGPAQLEGTGVRLVQVIVEETRKCSATAMVETLEES